MENSQTEFNVTADRKKFLQELQQKVTFAYEHPQKVHIDWKNHTIKEDIDQAIKLRDKLKNYQDDDIIECPEPEEQPYRVWVDNPHDYLLLLEMAVKELNKPISSRVLKQIRKNIQVDLEHEAEHYTLGIGFETFKIQYYIEYKQDETTGDVVYQPGVSIVGKIQCQHFKKMLEGPTNLSQNDITTIGQN